MTNTETVLFAASPLNPIWTVDIDGKEVPASRRDRIARAIELGASDKALTAIRDAYRTSTELTIVLPAHHLEGKSRGRGWARQGTGTKAVWGERDSGGYRVGPGKWTVGGNDGFNRKGETKWSVEHVQVGSETWTIAV